MRRLCDQIFVESSPALRQELRSFWVFALWRSCGISSSPARMGRGGSHRRATVLELWRVLQPLSISLCYRGNAKD